MEEEKCKQTIVSSTSSSPSHEFSFTVSLHSSSSSSSLATPRKIKQDEISPSAAIDLTPADEIFFHGHLLPLHFLSHLHATDSVSSPRHSTNSMDSFTIPIHQGENVDKTNQDDEYIVGEEGDDNLKTESKSRNKPFSLFKWRKGSAMESKVQRETQQQEHKRKVNKFDVSEFVKRYVKLLVNSPKGGAGTERRKLGDDFRRQTYSFSGAVSPKGRRDIRGKRAGEFSAPASMRTSPTNSGRLLPNSAGVPSPSSDSTMEELQAAIQAAIAHCKNSTGATQHKKPPEISAVSVT